MTYWSGAASFPTRNAEIAVPALDSTSSPFGADEVSLGQARAHWATQATPDPNLYFSHPNHEVEKMDAKDFLNPSSMLTPGIAGSVAMMISNTLWLQFELPQKWSGLGLSFALGMLVFAAGTAMPLWQRGIYYVLNSLIIFSMAVGATTLGHVVTSPQSVRTSALDEDTRFLRFVGIPAAHAQPARATAEESSDALKKRILILEQDKRDLQDRLQRAQEKPAAQKSTVDRRLTRQGGGVQSSAQGQASVEPATRQLSTAKPVEAQAVGAQGSQRAAVVGDPVREAQAAEPAAKPVMETAKQQDVTKDRVFFQKWF